MSVSLKVHQSCIRLVKDDITHMEVEAFVFYARPDLNLGSGFGNAISVRGGPSIQKELNEIGKGEVGEAIVTKAGKLKAAYIVHAIGPAFQEVDMEAKLRATIFNSLEKADDKGIRQIAFPAMGAGFYGVPLDRSARITVETIRDYLLGDTNVEEVIVTLLDNREYKPFQDQLDQLAGEGGSEG